MNSEQSPHDAEYLTVEEAAGLLRIGRTKAYALTQEWRTSGGRSGLPVVDLGSVLRVPRLALDEVIRTALVVPLPTTTTEVRSERLEVDAPAPAMKPVRPRKRRRNDDQLDLFDLPPAS